MSCVYTVIAIVAVCVVWWGVVLWLDPLSRGLGGWS